MPRQGDKDPSFMEEILQSLGLLDLADCHPQALSGGQKQRLAIACALVRDPDFLILDEPTSGMDAGNMNRLAGLLQEFAARGRGVVVVTHDAQFLAKSCSRAVLLDQGQVRMDSNLSQKNKAFTQYLIRGILPRHHS
jgi:energy-coupling factor transport system ATP-binding protein